MKPATHDRLQRLADAAGVSMAALVETMIHSTADSCGVPRVDDEDAIRRETIARRKARHVEVEAASLASGVWTF